MLSAKRRNDGAATLSSQKEFSEALKDDVTPLEALRRVVCGSYELARCLPTNGAHLLGETEAGRAEGEPTAFETLSRHVRAAQRAGQLRSGDASLITTLIVSTVLGAADFARNATANPGRGVSGVDFFPQLLLDLLAVKP